MTDKTRLERIPATSMDLTEHNLEQLKTLFPNIFTEGKLDLDALKAELGAYLETSDERYQFTWAGKEQAKRIATTPSLGTLRPAPAESVNWDETENLYIEGDNLEVLKLLQKSYFGRIKMIYIDPPYNTGKDFVYKDDFKDNLANYQRLTGQRDEKGNPLFTNTDSAGRYHSNWLNMMYPRLKLARNLLQEDGVIFISIDDNEVHNLRKICDEIFGEDNFLESIVWQKRTSPDARTAISGAHEYILIFRKSTFSEQAAIHKLALTNEQIKSYKNPDNDPKGPWVSSDFSAQGFRPNQMYSITSPSGKIHYPPEGNCWKNTKESFEQQIKEGRFWFGLDGNGVPRRKTYLSETEGRVPWTWWTNKEVGHTQSATQETKELLKGKFFDFPKPVDLLKRITQLASNSQDIIIDFFAGSSTTAQAVMQLNAEDNGKRKFIMVQIPEFTPDKSEAQKAGYTTIAEIGKERIRRAAAKIHEEHPETQADLGFKVLKLDTSNLKKWQPDYDNLADDLLDAVDNIAPGRSSEDLLYEALIKYGLPLTLPVKKQQVNGHCVYNVASGLLVACFDENISLDTVQAIIALGSEDKPILRTLFRDSSFADDIVKTNAIQRFKQAGIEDVLSI